MNDSMDNTWQILIAEDDRLLLKLFYKTFKHAGYSINIVSNGLTAWQILQLIYPDILIVDLGLPQLSGVEIIKRVQSHSEMNHTKIIVVTGNEHADKLMEGIEGPIVMKKPVSPRELVNVIQGLKAV